MTSFDTNKPIAIGSDHAGFEYKEILIPWLKSKGWEVRDFGTHSTDSTDYPDFAHPVAGFVESGEAAFGILLCGSGIGVDITANKHQGVRSGLCWRNEIAELCRQHNNCNIITVPARFVSTELAQEMVETFINTAFEGGRHEKRVEKIACSAA